MIFQHRWAISRTDWSGGTERRAKSHHVAAMQVPIVFTFSAAVIESSNQFQDNSTGFMGNVNYYHRFGLWETSGVFRYRMRKTCKRSW